MTGHPADEQGGRCGAEGAEDTYGRLWKGHEVALNDSFRSRGTGDRRLCLCRGCPQAGRPGTGAIREAALTDAQVVLGPDDSGGSGEARFISYPNKHKMCYTIRVSGIARATPGRHQGDARATSAHPHEAPAGQVPARSAR